MALEQTTVVSYRRVTTLFGCVAVMALCLTWIFLGMRQVMDLGGSCASGGPYVTSQPCPAGAALLSVGIPLMIVAAFLGSAVAAAVAAPTLLLPMWWLLFGSLGWNFLEFGAFHGDLVWGWLVCGVVFELMAAPALWLQLPWGTSGPPRLNPTPSSALGWWLAYAALGAAGSVLGLVTFHATG
ncbi:hypothetical protein [Nocardioides sp. URHA0020]|uniref:hypothetical protein n=1 Tax=Nocardioides sp. URHA0020 TaxID=1380392 RepID=UPI00048CD771|nr:hypothetical protein [Nocardioides sp. URHA0020]